MKYALLFAALMVAMVANSEAQNITIFRFSPQSKAVSEVSFVRPTMMQRREAGVPATPLTAEKWNAMWKEAFAQPAIVEHPKGNVGSAAVEVASIQFDATTTGGGHFYCSPPGWSFPVTFTVVNNLATPIDSSFRFTCGVLGRLARFGAATDCMEWSNFDLLPSSPIAPGATGTFTGTVKAPQTGGSHENRDQLVWSLVHGEEPLGIEIHVYSKVWERCMPKKAQPQYDSFVKASSFHGTVTKATSQPKVEAQPEAQTQTQTQTQAQPQAQVEVQPQPQAQTPVTTGVCEDLNDNCHMWAKNEQCKVNPGFMEHSCRLSCKICTRETVASVKATPAVEVPADEQCKDENENCPHWFKAGECHKNAPYMEKYCRQSCKRC